MKRVRADRATETAALAAPSLLETLELVANAITEAGEAALQQLIDDGDHCGIDIVFQRRAGGDK